MSLPVNEPAAHRDPPPPALTERQRPLEPAPRPWTRSRVLNVWVDDLSMGQLMDRLTEGVVFTPNLDHLYQLQRNKDFLDAYRQADFLTCDSRYIYWSLKWLGRPVQETVCGSDLVPAYCAHNARNPEVKVFFLGAAPGIAQRALERTNERWGREVAVGAHSPSMNFVNDEAEIEQVIGVINASGATAVVVGLGAPKQEIWIVKYKARMPGVKVWMGVGATIDYEAGVVRRAPRWMGRVGLEWMHRVTTDPKRYGRRYLRNVEFFWLLLLDALGLYRSPHG